MHHLRTVLIVLGCSGMLAFVVWAADPAPRAAKTKAAIDQQLAELGQQQVELSFTLRDQAQKNETVWMNPQYTSPEIDKLRQRMEVLKQEMVRLQLSLRELVAELPAAKAELEKLESGKAAYQALVRRIEELKKQREQLP